MNARSRLLTPAAAIATAFLMATMFAVAQAGDDEEPPVQEFAPDLAADEPEGPQPHGYLVLYQYQGLLSCGVGTGSLTPEQTPGASADLCFLETWTVDGWNASDPTFDAPAGSRAAVLELRWGPPTNTLEGDTLSLTAPSALETHFEAGDTQTAAGPSILRLDVPSADPAGTAASHTVRVQPGYDQASGLVLNKPWELRASVFVGMDVPDGYSAYNAQ